MTNEATISKMEQIEDCISRDEVKKTIDNLRSTVGNDIMDGIITENNINWLIFEVEQLPSVTPKAEWIPVSERLPETDNENTMNKHNVLLWVANKTHPEREPQIYLGKLRQVKGDDGSGNFWGIKTEPCEWTIWGWSYFNEPEVIAWMPLPQPYKAESEE